MEDTLQQRILTVLHQIPEGSLCTYGHVAELAGAPRHARMVGTLLKKLPNGSTIPWHRVINSQGHISFPQGSDKFLEQQEKLANEGVFMLNGKYNLRQYLWLSD